MVIDYTDTMNHALIAQGEGTNYLALEKLPRPYRRADKALADYMLTYRWLSRECTHANDEAPLCVLGEELTLWTREELNDLLKALESGQEVNLFEYFSLIG